MSERAGRGPARSFPVKLSNGASLILATVSSRLIQADHNAHPKCSSHKGFPKNQVTQ